MDRVRQRSSELNTLCKRFRKLHGQRALPSVSQPLDSNQQPINIFPQFSQLPLELKWEVCRHAVTSGSVITIRVEDGNHSASPDHEKERGRIAIAYTCWELYDEARQHILKNNLFKLANDRDGRLAATRTERVRNSLSLQQHRITRLEWLRPMLHISRLSLHASIIRDLILMGPDVGPIFPQMEGLTVIHDLHYVNAKHCVPGEPLKLYYERTFDWILAIPALRQSCAPKLRRVDYCFLGWSDEDGLYPLPRAGTTAEIEERLLPIQGDKGQVSGIICGFVALVNGQLRGMETGFSVPLQS